MKKVLLVAIIILGFNTCQYQKELEIPIEVIGGVPLMKASVGGKDVYFLLDTGAYYSFIDSAYANKLNLTFDSGGIYSNIQEIHTVGGVTRARMLEDFPIKLAETTFHTPCYSLNLHTIIPQIKQDTDKEIVGILGTLFFIPNRATIDLSHKTLTLDQ